jgi:hypothetical protein
MGSDIHGRQAVEYKIMRLINKFGNTMQHFKLDQGKNGLTTGKSYGMSKVLVKMK